MHIYIYKYESIVLKIYLSHANRASTAGFGFTWRKMAPLIRTLLCYRNKILLSREGQLWQSWLLTLLSWTMRQQRQSPLRYLRLCFLNVWWPMLKVCSYSMHLRLSVSSFFFPPVLPATLLFLICSIFKSSIDIHCLYLSSVLHYTNLNQLKYIIYLYYVSTYYVSIYS